MMLEAQLESNLSAQFQTLLSSYQDTDIVCSRHSYEQDECITEEEDNRTAIAIVCGLRRNDAFSLPTVIIPVSFSVTTRLELDKNGNVHEQIVGDIMDKLQFWHDRSGNQIMQNLLSTPKVEVHDLVMDGGSGRVLDRHLGTWNDTINIHFKGCVNHNLTTGS